MQQAPRTVDALPAPSRSGAAPLAPQPDPAPPVLWRLPRLGIAARVVPVTVSTDGDLGIPPNPQLLGWWSGGAAPGDPGGSVVIDGHIDSYQYGVGFFVYLHRLRPGDPVVLVDARQHVTRWTVTGLRQYPKDSLPIAQVFSQQVGSRLVLITCGGRFNHATRQYPDNVVAFASPATPSGA